MSSFASGYIKYINHLEQINAAALSTPGGMIGEVEEAYREHLRNIARNICERHETVRVVMLAGPTSSGKTTTARVLREYVAEFGAGAQLISLDDFYRGKGKAPLLPSGRYDYESVEALDVERVCGSLKAILKGEPIRVPRYSFDLGRPEEEEDELLVRPGEVAIVEGLHALNPRFTQALPATHCLKLYVSVKQQIKDANGEVISPMDLRLVRRIVRDVQFRNTTAEHTIAMWEEVIRGEDRYIRPYRLDADYTVNSVHIYEPCVLRNAAIPLLRAIPPESPVYGRARELESRLMRFEPVDPALVPETSMLREFLGPPQSA